jgi:hypothetical protein
MIFGVYAGRFSVVREGYHVVCVVNTISKVRVYLQDRNNVVIIGITSRSVQFLVKDKLVLIDANGDRVAKLNMMLYPSHELVDVTICAVPLLSE